MTSSVPPLESNEADKTLISPEAAYLAHYSEHLNNIRSHLTGSDGAGPLPPSFFAPGAYWTGAEKDAFFHGLAIHSRLRPDLIADEVKTKTITDVCVYLDMLEDGACESTASYRRDMPAALEVSDTFVEFEEEQAHALVGAEAEFDKEALQDVHDEEMQMRKLAIRARKGAARTESYERDREGERKRKKEFKKWLQNKKAEWKVEDTLHAIDLPMLKAMDRVLREDDEAQSEGEEETEDESHDPRYLVSADHTEPEREDIQGSSRPPDLSSRQIDENLIDPVLRAQSEPSAPSTSDPEPVALSSNLPEPSRRPTQPAHMPAYTLVHPHFQPSTPPFQNISLPSDMVNSLVTPLPANSRSTEDDELAEQDGPHLSPTKRRRLHKRLHMRMKRAEARGGAVVQTVEKLRPGPKAKPTQSQHGIKKSKGKETHDHDSSESSANEQPASKKRLRIGATSTDKEVVPVDAAFARPVFDTARSLSAVDGKASSSDDESPVRRPRRSGTTLSYRLLEELQASGLDAKRLEDEGLGVLHLGGLARLMRLYNRLHDVPTSVSSQISAEAIRLLHAHVVHFTTQLMHRTIVWREQELLAKVHTKAWRLSKNQIVSAVNVDHALMLLGYEKLSKKEHFKSIPRRFDLSDRSSSEDEEQTAGHQKRFTHQQSKRQRKRQDKQAQQLDNSISLSSSSDETAQDENQDENDGDVSNHDDEESILPPDLPLHRIMFPPLVRLPRTCPSPVSTVPGTAATSFYMPWPMSSSSTEPIAEEDLMSEETDADALREELLEEEKLDHRDRMVEKTYEKGLRAKFFVSDSPHHPNAQSTRIQPSRKRKRREFGSDGDDVDCYRYGNSALRFREPSTTGRIKSQVYVVDSD